MSNNRIFDFATGKPVDTSKPEEKVRQEYERILVEDYSYRKKQLDIEVRIQRGGKNSPKNKSERADIVIYKTTGATKRDQHADILGIVETKRKGRKDGVKQLMSYMSASSAQWGVWTNGTEISYLYHDSETGEVKENFIYQIPQRGEGFEDIGRISRDSLIPASNLTLNFRRILNTLYANTNISRREKLGNEMIRLIFCKIWDETYDVKSQPKFRAGFNEDPEEVKERIKGIFRDVKETLVKDGVFEDKEEISLDAKSVVYVVGELERYSLLNTDKDAVGDAFEVFAESKLVGEKGEFFTPREVVKTAVQIVNPQPGDTIIDPACGSGGFLIYTLEHVWREMGKIRKWKGMGRDRLEREKRELAQRTFFGIDKELDLVKISKAYMAIVGDGRGGIVQENTLCKTEDFSPQVKQLLLDKDNNFKKVDIVLTNPPFGSKIKVGKSESKNFELGYKWELKDNQYKKTDQVRETEPQVLFVERCLQLLKDGGKLAIVLPETYFHAPQPRYVLDYIRRGNNIIAIVDLAHNAFRPYNNAKCILLVLEKGRSQQGKIIMGIAEEIGHNHHGKPIFRYDESTKQFTDEIWDDTEVIREELKEPEARGNKNVFVIAADQIKNDVYVPRYYWKKRIDTLRMKAEKKGIRFVQFSDLVAEDIIADYDGHGSPEAREKGRGDIPYIRVADIVNWSIYRNPTSLVSQSVYKDIKGQNGVDLEGNDVLFVRRGSYRIGSVAIISKFDTKALLTREIKVFRVLKQRNEYGIDPFYLLYLLSHPLTQKQMYNKIFMDTTLPNIGQRWEELYLPVETNPTKRTQIKKDMKDIVESFWKGQKKIAEYSNEYGALVT